MGGKYSSYSEQMGTEKKRNTMLGVLFSSWSFPKNWCLSTAVRAKKDFHNLHPGGAKLTACDRSSPLLWSSLSHAWRFKNNTLAKKTVLYVFYRQRDLKQVWSYLSTVTQIVNEKGNQDNQTSEEPTALLLWRPQKSCSAFTENQVWRVPNVLS